MTDDTPYLEPSSFGRHRSSDPDPDPALVVGQITDNLHHAASQIPHIAQQAARKEGRRWYLVSVTIALLLSVAVNIGIAARTRPTPYQIQTAVDTYIEAHRDEIARDAVTPDQIDQAVRRYLQQHPASEPPPPHPTPGFIPGSPPSFAHPAAPIPVTPRRIEPTDVNRSPPPKPAQPLDEPRQPPPADQSGLGSEVSRVVSGIGDALDRAVSGLAGTVSYLGTISHRLLAELDEPS